MFKSPKAIISVVAKHTGISEENIISKHRDKDIVVARILSAALIQKFNVQISLTDIGKALGNRDHSTIIYLLKKNEDFLSYNKEYINLFNNIKYDIELISFEKKNSIIIRIFYKEEVKFISSTLNFFFLQNKIKPYEILSKDIYLQSDKMSDFNINKIAEEIFSEMKTKYDVLSYTIKDDLELTQNDKI